MHHYIIFPYSHIYKDVSFNYSCDCHVLSVSKMRALCPITLSPSFGSPVTIM
jgi:hypothetical protein